MRTISEKIMSQFRVLTTVSILNGVSRELLGYWVVQFIHFLDCKYTIKCWRNSIPGFCGSQHFPGQTVSGDPGLEFGLE